MGLLAWIFIILFVLKLNPGGHLDSPVQDLSWWWVTAPLWGLPVVLVVVAGIALLGGSLYESARVVKRKYRRRKYRRETLTKSTSKPLER